MSDDDLLTMYIDRMIDYDGSNVKNMVFGFGISSKYLPVSLKWYGKGQGQQPDKITNILIELNF